MENETLTAHDYWQEPGRYDIVNAWWKLRGMGKFPENLIPPLAVVVRRAGVAVAFLACYLSVGIGVARLDWMVTAPGQTAAESAAACLFAERALLKAAKVHGYSVAMTSTLPAAARFLKRNGWTESGDRVELVKSF